MKAFFINSEKQTVEEINLEPGLEEIYRHLDCNCIEAPFSFHNNGDVVYVDEEGAFHPDIKGAFTFEGYLYPLVRNGLIVGTNDDGEDVDAVSTLEEVKKHIIFLNNNQHKIES
jgi:hypothetical protein